jgi:hypothetical protein
MRQRKGSLPGINNINSGPKSLESLNNVDITRGKSFLPVMQNFGQVMPSRRIIKKDGSYGQVKDFNMPEIKEIRKPGFSGNFRTKPYEISESLYYLLDDISGSIAAYSVRKLSSLYTGSALRVRRSSDNEEQDIGFNSLGYLNESDLIDFIGVNSGFVTTWYDQSGNNLHAYQSSATSQPLVVNSGILNMLGTKVGIKFDGSNDSLVTSANFNHSALITAFSSWVALTGNRALFQIGAVNTLGSMFSFNTGGNSYNARTNATSGAEARAFVDSYGSHIINTGYMSNGAQEVYVDGVKGSQDGVRSFSNAVDQVLTIGSLTGTIYALDGSINELIIYPTDQRANRLQIESNLTEYFK